MKINHIIWVFLFGVFVFNLSGQNSRDIEKQKEARRKRQFRIAQRYQQSGMHENAIIILKKLYTQVPGRIQYYQELLESLIALSRIEEALILIDAQEATDPLNPRYEIDKGSVLYKAQKEKEAKKIWGEALDKHSENVAIYTMVANAMLNHGLFEEAVKVYEKGYKRHPDRTYFLQNIASLYRNKYQYTESLKYYLAYLKKEPKRAQSVTRQVLSFRLEPEQADSLIQILEKEAKRNKDRIEIQNLVAKFYQKYQKYEEAFEIYKKLENENTQGKYLLQFGRVMQADSAYSLALLAYMEVINRFPN